LLQNFKFSTITATPPPKSFTRKYESKCKSFSNILRDKSYVFREVTATNLLRVTVELILSQDLKHS
jgi:hypothetical protein